MHQTIKEFNAETSRQTNTIVALTKAMTVLTVVMTVAVFVQFWLMAKGL
jgi:hypothetical protein